MVPNPKAAGVGVGVDFAESLSLLCWRAELWPGIRGTEVLRGVTRSLAPGVELHVSDKPAV
uniref:Uncharacterized protein n=1 Tax=Anguilla anguilla TaxID=7936 RepID=A0A0E9RWA3_ANGAN